MKLLNLKEFTATQDANEMCSKLAKNINKLILENEKLKETIEILLNEKAPVKK